MRRDEREHVPSPVLNDEIRATPTHCPSQLEPSAVPTVQPRDMDHILPTSQGDMGGNDSQEHITSATTATHNETMEVVFVVDPVVQERGPSTSHQPGPARQCWWATTKGTVGEYRRLKAECPCAVYCRGIAGEDENEQITMDLTEWVWL